MRKEHKHHVIIISVMMLIILAVFVFVILNMSSGFTPGITTYVPPVQTQEKLIPNIQTTSANQQIANNSSTNIEIDVLIGFLILLALLFIWYLAIHIAKELRGHNP